MGRPSTYNEEIVATICERLAEGESLRRICADEGMPAKSTVMLWLAQHEAFSDQYARAREAQADYLAEDLLEIADDGRNDWMATQVGDGVTAYQANGEHIQRSRLRVDARKWLIAKMAPKKYGDRVTQEHTGPGGEGPVRHIVETHIVDHRPPDKA